MSTTKLDDHEPCLYILQLGKLMRVTAITDNMDEANAHMAANPGEGLLAEYAPFCLMASVNDLGAKPEQLMSRRQAHLSKQYALAASHTVAERRRRFVRTGEKRPPRKGEHYLSGAIPEVYRAPNDLSTSYPILREVGS